MPTRNRVSTESPERGVIIGVRPGDLDNLFLRLANPQAKTPSGIFLQS